MYCALDENSLSFVRVKGKSLSVIACECHVAPVDVKVVSPVATCTLLSSLPSPLLKQHSIGQIGSDSRAILLLHALRAIAKNLCKLNECPIRLSCLYRNSFPSCPVTRQERKRFST